MKRFYKLVSHSQTPNGYEIMLDGKAVNTPAKHKLLCPNEGLANAVMTEWAAQEDGIKPDTMPLTQLISTKIDRVSHERAAMSAALLKYLDTDLLCYRTDDPEELAQAQARVWDRWLSWLEDVYDIRLDTTLSLKALKQPQAAHDFVADYVKNLDDDRFTIFQLVTATSGSLILALAFIEKAANADDVFEAGRVEETYQDKLYKADQYGPDPAQEKKDKITRRDLEAAALYLGLLNP